MEEELNLPSGHRGEGVEKTSTEDISLERYK